MKSLPQTTFRHWAQSHKWFFSASYSTIIPIVSLLESALGFSIVIGKCHNHSWYLIHCCKSWWILQLKISNYKNLLFVRSETGDPRGLRRQRLPAADLHPAHARQTDALPGDHSTLQPRRIRRWQLQVAVRGHRARPGAPWESLKSDAVPDRFCKKCYTVSSFRISSLKKKKERKKKPWRFFPYASGNVIHENSLLLKCQRLD